MMQVNPEPSWIDPFVLYLKDGTLLRDPKDIIVPFFMASRQRKFLLEVVQYFIKSRYPKIFCSESLAHARIKLVSELKVELILSDSFVMLSSTYHG